jgi:transposase
LRNLGYSVEMYETLQLSKFLRSRRNKTDAGDAFGIAQAGRVGASLISKVYLKSVECQFLQSRLAIRRCMLRQRLVAVNLLCRKLEYYGARIRSCRRPKPLHDQVQSEIKRVFGRTANPLASDLRQLLAYCEQLFAYQRAIDDELKALALDIDVCRRLMTIPGVGPLCALTFYATIGEPHRFTRSSDVGAYLGLTPKVHQSGLSARSGRISRMGNTPVRTLLVQAAMSFMRWSSSDSELHRWASNLQQTRGTGRSRVALARKLAVIMVAMWKTGECYDERQAILEG